MAEHTQQAVLFDSPEPASEAFRLRLTFIECNWQRAKQDNARLSQKLLRLEQENQAWKGERRSLVEDIETLERRTERHHQEKEGLVKQLELRSQRHQAEQGKNISQGEKEILEKRTRMVEAEHLVMKDEQELLYKTHQAVVAQLDQERKEKNKLQEQLISLQSQNVEGLGKRKEMEGLYEQKVEILEAQNRALKRQVESLVIEVKLFERKKKFEELIAYEGNIGSEDHFSKVHCRNSTTVLHFGRRDENCDPNSFDFDSYSSEFEEELSGKEELIELLKQKNRRLSTELEGLHRRCVNLQNIVCGESTLLA